MFALDYCIALAFIALSFLAKTRPWGAALTGLILFLSVQILGMVLEPENIYKGILIKVLVIVALVRAMKAGLEYRNYTTEKQIKAAFD